MPSPAERYAASRRRQEEATPALSAFSRLYPFGLDGFQREACRALEGGRGVLVAAPTGAGKTVVGEFAAHLALADGRKCFYTTPIKALSNQKYTDLLRRYGPERVGLLTGDNAVNGDAPVVVMTTEVLRNMIYASSAALHGLGYVVMDEVHYLADRFRGAVWEEVIIHLPESVRLVSLSATVSNAEEFGEWLTAVRGDTAVIVSEHRPVPLWQHVLVGRRLYDLFVSDGQGPGAPGGPEDGVGTSGGAAPADAPYAASGAPRGGTATARRPAHGRGDGGGGVRVNPELLAATRPGDRLRQSRDAERVRSRRPRHLSSRYEVIERLDADGLLPAITFIFSRAGCDAAVAQCLSAGLRLNSPAERARVRAYAEERCETIPREDLHVLGYHEWLEALECGIAAHHAGMLPTFKEVVEELFARGLVKAVFATETLALGINMPARSVVLEKLVKWNGEAHADITPGEYTQLTGRAGRRGIDVEGHAVVVWHPGMDPRAVAGLAGARTYPLRSSFRPSYNMAVNLVGGYGRARSRDLLETSFAQFQADRAVVGLARQAKRNAEALAGYADAMRCHLGDFTEYAGLRRALTDREAELSRQGALRRRTAAAESLERLRPGDVIHVPAGRRSGLAVVLDPGDPAAPEGPRPTVLTIDRQVKRLTIVDFPTPVEPIERLRIPRGFNARSANSRRDLVSTMRAKVGEAAPLRARRRRAAAADDEEVARLRAAIRAHPCHGCAEREDHARWAERYFRLQRENAGLEHRISGRTNTIARTFDRVCALLDDLGYLDGDAVTDQGRRLGRLYSELDLLAAECLRDGVWDGLSPAELAACVSSLVYESRQGDDVAPPRLPRGQVRDALARTVRIWGRLEELEGTHGLSFLREPDLGFAWPAFQWAGGAPLETVLRDADLTAGDFVRWVKQLVDILGQIADAAGGSGRSGVRVRANAAVDALRRGVVAYTSLT